MYYYKKTFESILQRIKGRFLFFGVLIILLSSCDTKDVEPITETQLSTIEGKYLFTNVEYPNQNCAQGTAYFTYINNKLAERSGGFIQIAGSSGYSGFYLKEVFDTLININSDKIIIEHKDRLDGLNVGPCKREYTFSGGKLIKKITFNNAANYLANDTTIYNYGSDKKIISTEHYFSDKYYIKTFSFNSAGNLTSVNGVGKKRIDSQVFVTTEELFSDYDNTKNPLTSISLLLWDDTFYRVLSTNNFSKYSFKQISMPFNTISKSQQLIWTYFYDPQGNIDYTK